MKVIIDDIRYHVEICGDGFPLLLLHGFTGDSSTWLPFCNVWGEKSKLIIPDILGHGKTESPDNVELFEMEKAATDLSSILDQIGVDQVDLLGYSMGGRLALTFAFLYPGKVRKLVLESASPGLPTEEERRLRRMKDAELAQFINEQGIQPFVDYWEAIPLFSTMNHNKDKEVIRKQRLSNSPKGLANSLLGMGTGSQPSWWEKLSELQADVLLLTGKKDKKFSQIAEKMMKKLEKATWIVFDDCGHAIHVEEAEKFGTIVSDFLSKEEEFHFDS